MSIQEEVGSGRNGAELPVPVVVIEAEGGAYHCFRSSAPARVIILDQDVEGSDQDAVLKVNGQMVNVIDYKLDHLAQDGGDGVACGYVADVVMQVDTGLAVSDAYVPAEIRQPANDDWAFCLRFAVERIRIANAEGNPILSAWLPGAEALLQAPAAVMTLPADREPQFSAIAVAEAVLAACRRQVGKGRSLDGLNLDAIVHGVTRAQFDKQGADEDEERNVRKSVLQFVVLHDDKKDLASMSLEEIGYECREGAYIGGGLAVVSSGDLTREQLAAEAAKLGSDATFFDVDTTDDSHTPSV